MKPACRRKVQQLSQDDEMHTIRNWLGKRGLFVGALVAFALAGCGTAQNQTPTATASVASAPEATLSRAQPTQQGDSRPTTTRARTSPIASTKQNTAKVLIQIRQTDLTEIALGKLAQEKASTDEVRMYAGQLVQDHTNVDKTVVAMALKSGARLPNDAAAHRDVPHKTVREKQLERPLKSAGGHDFDRRFLQETKSDHERLIRMLQQDREDASNDELEALIDKLIPILEQHRELQQILLKKEKV
jgi:putative membrane protein